MPPTTATQQAGPTFQLLAIAQLHESPHNPRKHFDPASLAELADSLKIHGVLTPLTVRAHGRGYEIAAGHRRYRAAKLAGLTEVPAIVRAMTDEQFLEVLVIENDQREDVHPLEEAAGYQALLALKPTDGPRYDVARIAERVGRSDKYVYDRIKLLNLTEEAKELFFANRITAGHAILLARLSAADQKRVLDEALWEDENLLFHPEEKDRNFGEGFKLISVRELQAWIDGHVRFEANQADPMLFPETVDTMQAVAEEGQPIVAITHEIMTPEDVKDGPRPILGRSWKRADGKKGSKPCDHSVMGFITIGPGRGEAFKVCVHKDKCRVHWDKEIAAREKRQKAREKGESVPGRSSAASLAEDRRRDEENRAKQKALQDRWEQATPAIMQALAERVKAMPTHAKGLLADLIMQAVTNWDWRERGKKYQNLIPRGITTEDLVRHAALIILHEHAANKYSSPEHFPKMAKAYGVDVQKVLDEAVPVEPPKAEKPAKAKKGKAA